MRVLHVLPSLDPDTGGPARSVPALCGALQTAGVNAVLFALRPVGAPVTVSPETAGFPLRCFAPLPGSRQLPTVRFYAAVREAVRSADLVHLHSLWNPVISAAAYACRRAGVPYLLSPRGMLQAAAVHRKGILKAAYYHAVERRTIAGAAALHFVTRGEAEDSGRFVSGTTGSVVIPSGVDPAVAARAVAGRFRERYPELEGRRMALFLGRLHWSKGLELQAESLRLLVADFPDLVWVLAGPDGGQARRLLAQASRSGLEGHLLWTGPLPWERCLEALADADVFLLTSRHEAHSNAMNEALAVGVPLVMTETVRFGDVGEYGAGRLVGGDPREVAAAVADILSHPDRAKQMREAGRRLAAERLAWPKVAAAMTAAYGRTLGHELRPGPGAPTGDSHG